MPGLRCLTRLADVHSSSSYLAPFVNGWEGDGMRRPDPLREFAITVGMALPGFLACSIVYLAIDPIASGRWQPIAGDSGQSLALVSLSAYLVAGLLIAACTTDGDILLGGGSIATVFSLGLLVPVSVGLGRGGAAHDPLFGAVLWLQPLLAILAYLVGVGLAMLMRALGAGWSAGTTDRPGGR